MGHSKARPTYAYAPKVRYTFLFILILVIVSIGANMYLDNQFYALLASLSCITLFIFIFKTL